MLCLSRKLGESITIDLPDGRIIKITLNEIGINKARIGIDAPRDINIARTELVPPKPVPPLLRIGD